MKKYTCPRCKKSSESIGVISKCSQTVHLDTDDWTNLEVGETIKGYCLLCGEEIDCKTTEKLTS